MTLVSDLPARSAQSHAGSSQGALARALPWLLFAGLLVLFFGLAVGSMQHKSPVVGEGQVLARGWAFWQSGHLLPASHPPLADLAAGLPLLLEPGTPPPASLPGWEVGDLPRFSRVLLWQSGLNASRMVFLARLPALWLALLLGAVLWRWGRDLHGQWGGALALALYAFSPTMLAYAPLATFDLGAAALITMVLYAWQNVRQHRPIRWLLVGGVALGLALAASYTALLLVPVLVVMALWQGIRRGAFRLAGTTPLSRWLEVVRRWPLGDLWSALAMLGLLGLVAGLVLALVYLVVARQVFTAAYGQELARFLAGLPGDTRPYLLGRFSPGGWWYQAPILLGVKLPIPTLLLAGLALVLSTTRKLIPREWDVLFPGLLYVVMLSALPLGPELRLLLPSIPLLFLFIARLASGPSRFAWVRQSLAGALVASLVAASLLAYPDYLAFFNAITGGANGAAQVLAGSNLDWGQDLPELAAYLKARRAGPVYLSTYGEADPAYYGIDYLALPSHNPAASAPPVAFYPLNPAPGLYAISATALTGALPGLGDTFGYFRSREPVERVGGSIYIYEVFPSVLPQSERGAPWLAQCAIPAPLELVAVLEDLTGLDDLHVFNFDCRQSLPFRSAAGWLLLPADREPFADLGPADYVARSDDGTPRYRIWLGNDPPPPPSTSVDFPAVPLPLPVAGYLELLGYGVSSGTVRPGEELALTSWWRIREVPSTPITIVAQFASPDGAQLTSLEGSGVPIENWQPGMVIIQQHRFPVAEGSPPGVYTLDLGLYSPAAGRRLAVFESGQRVVDRIVLRTVEVVEPR